MNLDELFAKHDKNGDGLDYYEFTNLLYYDGAGIFPALSQPKITNIENGTAEKDFARAVLQFAQTHMAEISGDAPNTPFYNCSITKEELEKYLSENRDSLSGQYIEHEDVVKPEVPLILPVKGQAI